MASQSRDQDLDDDDAEGGADIRPTAAKPTLLDRLRYGSRPSRPDPSASAPSTRRVIERLDDRERLICFAASGLAVLTGVLIYVVETENKNFRLRKGELTPQTSLIIGLVTGVLLLVATLIGRRAPVGFVSLFVFLAFGTQYFSGIPFLVLAVWLLYRSYKYQKEVAATRRAASGNTPSGGSSPCTRGSPGRTTPKPGAKGASRVKTTAGREANKRYTPKRPPPPPPKPSRRERKAAQGSD